MAAHYVNQTHKLLVTKKKKNLPVVFSVYCHGGPSGRSSGSCVVAMTPITHTGRAMCEPRNETLCLIVVFVAAGFPA